MYIHTLHTHKGKVAEQGAKVCKVMIQGSYV